MFDICGGGLGWYQLNFTEEGKVEAFTVFVEGINTNLMAEVVESLGEFEGVDDAATGFGGVGEEGDGLGIFGGGVFHGAGFWDRGLLAKSEPWGAAPKPPNLGDGASPKPPPKGLIVSW